MNDCVLFRKDKAKLNRCSKCDALRHKIVYDGMVIKLSSVNPVLVQVLHHFPLTRRLKRLFMSSKIAPLMRWHASKQEGNLRHLAEAHAQKEFDNKYSKFSCDPRNVRRCLSSDGSIHFEI